MFEAKKTLKTASIVCFVCAVLNIIDLFSHIFLYEQNVFMIISTSLSLAVSLASGIIYIYYMNKSNDIIISKKSTFVLLMFLNIFNNVIAFGIAFWVQFVVTSLQRTKFFTNIKYKNNDETDSETIIIEPSDYEITTKAEILSQEIKKLEEMRNKKLITEEEYSELRAKIISKYCS